MILSKVTFAEAFGEYNRPDYIFYEL